jgi:hypothetical protein
MSKMQTLTQPNPHDIARSPHQVPMIATSVLIPSNGPLILHDSRDVIALGILRTPQPRARRLIAELGWSAGEAWETRRRLRSFEEDWDAPGMDAYDDL